MPAKKYHPVIIKLQSCYYSMMSRCYNKNNCAYRSYGGRGVKVCKLWKKNYQHFLDWALVNGWKPGLQLDKDINGNGFLYSPRNCCFVTREDNMNNRCVSKLFKFRNKMLSIPQISRLTGVPEATLTSRVSGQKLSIKQAILKPRLNPATTTGENNPLTKIPLNDAKLIIALYSKGIPAHRIWKERYSNTVSYNTVKSLIRGDTYKNLNRPHLKRDVKDDIDNT